MPRYPSTRVTAVPKEFTVTKNATSDILRTGGAPVIKLVISSSADALGTNLRALSFSRLSQICRFEKGGFCKKLRDSCYARDCPQIR